MSISTPAILSANITGALTTSSTAVFRMPFKGYVTGASAAVGTAPTGAALTATLVANDGVLGRLSIAVSTTSADFTLSTGAFTVTNKALTSNVATLTTSAVHGYAVGDVVTVNNVGDPFDGTYTISVVGSTTTFGYVRTKPNVSSVAVAGAAGATAQSSSPAAFNAGQLVTLAVTQIGSSVAGSNLGVVITVQAASDAGAPLDWDGTRI
jgi:hypothetical protein